MIETNVRSRVLCAVGAVLLTGLSSIVFMPVESHSPGAQCDSDDGERRKPHPGKWLAAATS